MDKASLTKEIARSPVLQASIDIAKSLKYEAELKHYVRHKLIPQRFINIGKVQKIPKAIGFVGPWGSGKSLSEAAMTILDYLIEGKDVWSNMDIVFGVKIADTLVAYSTEPLNKIDLLKLKLNKGALVIDEPNIEFAEARRAMSNRNLQFDKVLQMLRKREMSLNYAVISEMWVEQRLREVTTMFIKCQDLLLEPGNLGLPFEFGEKVTWKGYDMIGILGHGSFMETHQVAFHRTFNAKPFWRTYDTDLVQGENQVKYGHDNLQEFEAALSVEEQPHMIQYKEDWKWLRLLTDEMLEDGRRYIPAAEIMNNPLVKQSQYTQIKLSNELKRQYGIKTKFVRPNGKGDQMTCYEIQQPVLVERERGEGEDE